MAVLDEAILTKSKFWQHLPGPVVRVRVALATPRRWVMWFAVFAFGHWAYKKGQAKGDAPPREREMLLDVEAQMLGGEGGLPA